VLRKSEKYEYSQHYYYLSIKFDNCDLIISKQFCNAINPEVCHSPVQNHLRARLLLVYQYAQIKDISNRKYINRHSSLKMKSERTLSLSACIQYSLYKISLFALAIGPTQYDFSLIPLKGGPQIGRLCFNSIFSHRQNLVVDLDCISVNLNGQHYSESLYVSFAVVVASLHRSKAMSRKQIKLQFQVAFWHHLTRLPL
jgi:hypothetical protein